MRVSSRRDGFVWMPPIAMLPTPRSCNQRWTSGVRVQRGVDLLYDEQVGLAIDSVSEPIAGSTGASSEPSSLEWCRANTSCLRVASPSPIKAHVSFAVPSAGRRTRAGHRWRSMHSRIGPWSADYKALSMPRPHAELFILTAAADPGRRSEPIWHRSARAQLVRARAHAPLRSHHRRTPSPNRGPQTT